MENIIITERASVKAFFNKTLLVIARIAMISIVYINIPLEIRHGVVRFGFCVMVLMFIIAYAVGVVFLMCYRLVVIQNATDLIIEEKFIFVKRQKNFTKPVEVRCRQLGGGRPRRVFIKSLSSNAESFFGAPLNKDGQDNIVREISSGSVVSD